MTEPLTDVLQAIRDERTYQDAKWGGTPNDDVQAWDNWIQYITEYAQGSGRASNYSLGVRMVKCCALGVAAVQAYDRAVLKTNPTVDDILNEVVAALKTGTVDVKNELAIVANIIEKTVSTQQFRDDMMAVVEFTIRTLITLALSMPKVAEPTR